MSKLEIKYEEFVRLKQAMQQFPGNMEKTVNDVLHGDAGNLIKDEIVRLMPVSGRSWVGKKPAAKTSKSLMIEKGNLFVVVKTTKNYNYLYFPDDGTNTKYHAGNKQFFYKAGITKQSEIIDRCIMKLVGEL